MVYQSKVNSERAISCPLSSKSVTTFRLFIRIFIFELKKCGLCIYNMDNECIICYERAVVMGKPHLVGCHDDDISDHQRVLLPRKQGLRMLTQPLPAEVEDKFQPYASIYELTLTTDNDDVYELRTAFHKIVKSAMFSVKGYIACIELTKLGLPHIHALLFSNSKYIDASKIKKLYKKRYECKRVRQPENYYNYLFKEKENPLIIDYCAKKGIEQFWEYASTQAKFQTQAPLEESDGASSQAEEVCKKE